VLEGGGKGLADLIASVDRGLLVTRFWYIRVVNPQTMQMTGRTRDGVFLIEQGKVTSPVMNFRFNQSPVEMLKSTVGMGAPVRVRGGEGQGMIAPAIVVKDFRSPVFPTRSSPACDSSDPKRLRESTSTRERSCCPLNPS
jgi:predicted Zn-dependent protease